MIWTFFSCNKLDIDANGFIKKHFFNAQKKHIMGSHRQYLSSTSGQDELVAQYSNALSRTEKISSFLTFRLHIRRLNTYSDVLGHSKKNVNTVYCSWYDAKQSLKCNIIKSGRIKSPIRFVTRNKNMSTICSSIFDGRFCRAEMTQRYIVMAEMFIL
jgi:hypothetical protein